MHHILDNVTVVIRSSSERTESLCKSITERQIHTDNIFLIHESPFSEAVRRTFEIGIECRKDWTLALDADILLRKNAIADLVSFGESLNENYFEVQGGILDKLFCIPRNGGPHLFRTKYLKKAIEYIPEEGSNLRPESTVFYRMVKDGYDYYNNLEIYGIHDYYQYYRDIYRKCFLQAHKHSQFLNYFFKIWKEKAVNDFDYQVALWGLASGRIFSGSVTVDVNLLKTEIEQVFKLKNLEEKDLLPESEIAEEWITNEIESYQASSSLQKSIEETIRCEVNSRVNRKNKKFYNRIFAYAAVFFERLSHYLRKYA